MTNEQYENITKKIQKQIQMQKNFMNMINEENKITNETEKMTKEYFFEIEKYY
jgi:hypothetical protein